LNRVVQKCCCGRQRPTIEHSLTFSPSFRSLKLPKMANTPLLHAVTILYLLIFKTLIFRRRRSRGSSSCENSKIYERISPWCIGDRFFSATDFTVTSVTNFHYSIITIVNIIQLLNVTVKEKWSKKAVAVTNCYTPVTNCYIAVTRYCYTI
jgi:hypothetical protein